MQTASYVDIDNWDDLIKEKDIVNIRPKGTYKPLPKPVYPPASYKPCCQPDAKCPIDNQPLPVPCDLCPVKEQLDNMNTNNTNCNNCQNCNHVNNENNESVYGVSQESEDKLLNDVNNILVNENIPDTPAKPVKVKKVTRTKKTTAKSKTKKSE